MTDKNGMKCDGTGVWCGLPGCCPAASPAPSSAQEGQSLLTEAVRFLSKVVADAAPMLRAAHCPKTADQLDLATAKVLDKAAAILARQSTLGSEPQAEAIAWPKNTAEAVAMWGSMPPAKMPAVPHEQAASRAAVPEDEDILRLAIPAKLIGVLGDHPDYEAHLLDFARRAIALAAAPVAQEGKAVDGQSVKPEPLNGIPATMRHDEGAIACCSYCGRYSLDPKTLSDRQPECECGKRHGWSGSFKRPGPDARWSGKAPAAQQDSSQVDAPEGGAK